MTSATPRNGKRWSVNEILRLQREYELLELDVSKIAELHGRNEQSILFRLVKEGFAENFESIRGYNNVPLESIVTVCPKTEFSLYVDNLITKNILTLKEIQDCVNEKVAESGKPQQAKKVKRVLRKYLHK